MSSDALREVSISILTDQGNQSGDQGRFSLFGDAAVNAFRKRDTAYFKLVPIDVTSSKKGFEKFCTGSSYMGEWHTLGICGQGTYYYPHGVDYVGRFNKNGQFHGQGTLTYPNGQQIRGVWKNGKLFEHAYVLETGDEIDEQFTYCKMPDRRFFVERAKYFGPTGLEYLTDDFVSHQIPKNCFNVGRGIFDPKSGITFSHVIKSDVTGKYRVAPQVESCQRHLSDEFVSKGRVMLEVPTSKTMNWVKANCRKAWDEPVGYRPDLYENWNAGRRRETIADGASTWTSFVTAEDKPPMEKESQTFFSFIKKIKKPMPESFSVFGKPTVRDSGTKSDLQDLQPTVSDSSEILIE